MLVVSELLSNSAWKGRSWYVRIGKLERRSDTYLCCDVVWNVDGRVLSKPDYNDDKKPENRRVMLSWSLS